MNREVRDPNGNRHSIKVDDDLSFLIPYLFVAKKLGVPVWRISRIKGYSVPYEKSERQLAATIRDVDAPNKKVTITLLKWHQNDLRASGYESATESNQFENTLDTFAHELTHLVHWEHTADRYIFEKKLQKSFAFTAKRLGYQGYKG
jgi:hypothetical protein